MLQYGVDRVARYLRVDVEDGRSLAAGLRAHHEPSAAATVFSRFLRHLAYLELPDTTAPVPELHWFPASGAVR